ncbi:hypothetical protein D3C80_1021180 [compost metagenome]
MCPSAFFWFAKSTIKIAFFATNPISMIIPSIEKILIGSIANASASKAPMIASGMENKTTNG